MVGLVTELRDTNRPYQNEAIDVSIADIKSGDVGGVIKLPTGSGKSRINVCFSREAINIRDRERILCIGGINEDLVWQMHDNYIKYWPELDGMITLSDGTLRRGIGVVMNKQNRADAAVVCASIQTLIVGAGLSDLNPKSVELLPITADDVRRTKHGVELSPNSKRNWLVSPRVDAILKHGLIRYISHDECHHAPADGSMLIYLRIFQLYEAIGERPVFRIGFTATTKRADGRALANIFPKILYEKSYEWMVRHEYAAEIVEPERVIIPIVEDNSGNRIANADGYELSSVRNWAEIIVDSWREKASGRKTLAYIGKHNGNSHLEDLEHFYNVAKDMGVVVAYIDGQRCIDPDGNVQPKSYRSTLYGQLNDINHPLQMIANYEVVTEGNDIPEVSCVCIARSMNAVTATQTIGRGTRTTPTKQDLKVLIFTGDDIVLMTVADLSGTTVDPTLQEFVPDINVAEFRRMLRQYTLEKPDVLIMWKNVQKIFSDETLDTSVKKLCNEKVADDECTKTDVRILKMVVGIFEDEDKLFQQINLLDLSTKEGMAQGRDKQFKVVELMRASNNLWSHDEKTNMLVVGVGENRALVIHPPQYGKAESVKEILAYLRSQDELDEKTISIYKTVLEFCNNYTAFYVSTQNVFKPHVVQEKGGWFASSPYIDVIEEQAMAYARNQKEYEPILSEKKKSWHYKTASDAQLGLVAALIGLKGEDKIKQLPDEYLWYVDRKGQKVRIKMGAVSKIITKLSAPRALSTLRQRVDIRIEAFAGQLDDMDNSRQMSTA